MAFISQKHGQFTYFSMQLGEPDWSKKDVLDFGGNVGNIMRDPNSNIDSQRFWCIDVNKDAIECGRRAFPESHWVAYDRRCFFFNPGGKVCESAIEVALLESDATAVNEGFGVGRVEFIGPVEIV